MNELTIGISISNHFSVPWQFAEAIIALIAKYPMIKVMRAHGSLIHENRNYLVKHCTTKYLLMIDTDIVFTTEDVVALMNTMEETRCDMVTGVYKEGYPPHSFALFDEDDKHVLVLPNELFKIGSCGMGFCLFNKKSMAGEYPFDPIMDSEKRYGEDLSFCIRAKRRGLSIICNPLVNVKHLRLKPV